MQRKKSVATQSWVDRCRVALRSAGGEFIDGAKDGFARAWHGYWSPLRWLGRRGRAMWQRLRGL